MQKLKKGDWVRCKTLGNEAMKIIEFTGKKSVIVFDTTGVKHIVRIKTINAIYREPDNVFKGKTENVCTFNKRLTGKEVKAVFRKGVMKMKLTKQEKSEGKKLAARIQASQPETRYIVRHYRNSWYLARDTKENDQWRESGVWPMPRSQAYKFRRRLMAGETEKGLGLN